MFATSHLLLALPNSLFHPPTHQNHIVALYASLLSIRKALSLHEISEHQQNPYGNSLNAEMTCQAWTLLAEVGMMILSAGLGGRTGPGWSSGIEDEIEQAIGKGLQLASKQISLRPFWSHLTMLHSHLALWQGNAKFSRAILKRVQSNLTSLDSPQVHYSILLAQHANFLSPLPHSSSVSTAPQASSRSSPSSSTLSQSDILSALQAIHNLRNVAAHFGHQNVMSLANVIRLRTLVRAEMWHARPSDHPDLSVQGCLIQTEHELGLRFDIAPDNQPPEQVPQFVSNLRAHVLVISVLYFTLTGESKDASIRLSRLHQLLDAGVSEADESSYFTISLNPGPPLIIKTTHPRVLYDLAFLVSSVSKRDPVGRKPRRKVFAAEGLKLSEGQIDELFFPKWATLADAQEVEDRLAKIRADLLCEMVAVCITRSEFEDAEQRLNEVIAHTRTYNIFPYFAARITLHQAHLAHATLQTERALKCYRVAAYLDDEEASESSSHAGRSSGFVRVAARAGEVGLRLGLRALHGRDLGDDGGGEDLSVMTKDVIEECKRFRGTLQAIGRLLEAITSGEIVKAKQRLKASLDTASASQDNHLRALVLAMTSAHYYDTASDHAKVMLETSRQLAAGMGAPAIKPTGHSTTAEEDTASNLGNTPLGLWVGERFLELYRRQGSVDKIQHQLEINEAFRRAVHALPTRVAPQKKPFEDAPMASG